MIRFILNFILFGLLFYALWLFVPDIFAKLTSWAGALFSYLEQLFNQFSGRLQHTQPAPTTTAPAILFLLENLKRFY